MNGNRVKFNSSYIDLTEVPIFDDTVEETEMRENVENYPDPSIEEDAPIDIFSTQRKKTSFYGDIEGVHQPHSDLRSRHMPFVNISSSELRHGNFEMANMVCSSISHSLFQGSNFKYADM